jgi:hypothetical protein
VQVAYRGPPAGPAFTILGRAWPGFARKVKIKVHEFFSYIDAYGVRSEVRQFSCPTGQKFDILTGTNA